MEDNMMKVQYLGTAAAERIPAMFCACDTCKRAMKAGGRNLMARSQMLIDDDLLIDFSGDTYSNFLRIGKTLCDVEYLLITHAHEDHFSFEDFHSRMKGVAYNVKAERLKVYLSEVSYDIMCRSIEARNLRKTSIFERFEFITVKPYTTFAVGDYTVTALPAIHASENEALLFLIEKDGKSVFYGNDTGYFPEEIDDFLKKNGKTVDLLSLDCTKCDNEYDYYIHMSMSEGRRIADRFAEKGLIDQNTRLYYTHFSHNGKMTYDDMEPVARQKYGFEVAYDLLTVEI